MKIIGFDWLEDIEGAKMNSDNDDYRLRFAVDSNSFALSATGRKIKPGEWVYAPMVGEALQVQQIVWHKGSVSVLVGSDEKLLIYRAGEVTHARKRGAA